MSQKPKTSISPTREENFPEWYQQVIRSSDMAENSEVRGCMVIKPWGFGIWENIQQRLDLLFKQTGHENAYFPLLIPLSYLEKEAEHAEGFATECAVVTHHRLEAKKIDGKNKLVPSGELAEPFVIRPTSETIIGSAFARWIKSYRDLPLLINQWANVMRWEMRPRLFLRTAEFLWQEGHTAHETKEEAIIETKKMLEVYRDFMINHLALPVIAGEKSERERFPGALNTYTVEALVQDRKSIQAGTSHFLGQNFSKAANIKFQSREGKEEFVWTTSWGVSTRMIGTLIMAHSDDDGLVLPPRVAPIQVVILPVLVKNNFKVQVLKACDELAEKLQSQEFSGEKIRVKVDVRDYSGGVKKWEWIKKGVPIILEIGPRDLDKGICVLLRRDDTHAGKQFLATEEFIKNAGNLLTEIQENLLARAIEFRKTNTKFIDNEKDFYNFFTDNKNINGGFVLCPWSGNSEDEEKLQRDIKVTLRCIPDASNDLNDLEIDLENVSNYKCFLTGNQAKKFALFAKSY